MIQQMIADGSWLPYTFAFLMGLAMLIYALLDGYDLGVGMLLSRAKDAEKDRMVASIGPFWDANETWLILGVGILLVAFPLAHGLIIGPLYLPVTVMLFGLIFRGVSFDFRAKVPPHRKPSWDRRFFLGSLLTSLAQGYMLGSYIVAFDRSLLAIAFSLMIAVVLSSAYCLIGANWLIMKCEGELQRKSIRWAKVNLLGTTIGLAAISMASPFVSDRIFAKWFSFPELLLLSPIPILTVFLLIATYLLLRKMPLADDRYCWLPFVMTIGIFKLSFVGLAYSFFPYLVPEKMTILQAAAAPESLLIMLFGALLVLPMLIGYTSLAYYIFRGKTTDLRYD